MASTQVRENAGLKRDVGGTVADLVLVVVDACHRKRLEVCEAYVHNALFLAKEKQKYGATLDEISFSWGRYGPISKAVQSEIDSLKRNGMRFIQNDADPRKLGQKDADMHPVSHDAPSGVVKWMGKVIAKHPSLPDIKRRTYKRAPYKWYRAYDLKFRPHIRECCGSTAKPITSRKMLTRLEHTLDTIPDGPEFRKLRLIHNCLCRVYRTVLLSDGSRKNKKMVDSLAILADEIWEAFADRVETSEDGNDAAQETHWSREKRVWEHAKRLEEEYGDAFPEGMRSLSKGVEARLAKDTGSAAVTPDEFKRELEALVAR